MIINNDHDRYWSDFKERLQRLPLTIFLYFQFLLF